MITDVQFAAAAEKYMGVAYHHTGRTLAGCDCVGIPFGTATDCGVPMVPFFAYEPTPDPNVLLREVSKRCDPREWADWRSPGRVLVLRHRHDGPPRHFGVSLGAGRVIAMHRTGRIKPLRIDLLHSVWLVRGVVVTQ